MISSPLRPSLLAAAFLLASLPLAWALPSTLCEPGSHVDDNVPLAEHVAGQMERCGKQHSSSYTASGDRVGMNGPGRLDVRAPNGAVYTAYNPPNCCATTDIPAGIVAHGTWVVSSDVSSSGWPRFGWTIAGWTVESTGFLCGPSSPVTLWLDYDARAYSYSCS